MSEFSLRPGGPDDAAILARMLNEMNRLHGLPDDQFSAERVRRDGFGDRPAFDVLIAERDGRQIGYALFVDFYDTDVAGRGIWLTDIFVDPKARSQGIGRALIAAVAREAKARGGRSVWWGVDAENARARALYARVGARDDDGRILQLDGAAFEAMAAAAPPLTTGTQ